ncbi:MAG: DUF4157 domain-containing protein [Longimicrobiaceae bacterium]
MQRYATRSGQGEKRAAVRARSPAPAGVGGAPAEALAPLQARANAGPHAAALAGLQAVVAQRACADCDRVKETMGGTVQRAATENRGGLPGGLRAGLESLSGRDLSGVRVHYGSPKPAQLAAHAYTQGSEIHVAAGQERHLPHEGWHAVQQMEGRVRPTLQLHGTAINDDGALEREAEVMGARAARAGTVQRAAATGRVAGDGRGVVQRIINLTATQYQARVAAGGALTLAQLSEYFNLVLRDDYGYARAYANPIRTAADPAGAIVAEPAALAAWFAAMRAPLGAAGIAPNVAAADGLAALVNAITAQATFNHPGYGVPAVGPPAAVPQVIPMPNTRTRYASAPEPGYDHTNLRPSYVAAYNAAGGTHAAKTAAAAAASPAITWADEATGQALFGAAAGPVLTAVATPETASMTALEAGQARPAIKQLTWAQAKEFLPRALVNLLFDVKSQLTGGAPVIDERTPFDRSPAVRNATPTDPGTLRSWHEDSRGILPAHAIAAPLVGAAVAAHLGPTVTTPGGTVAPVPAGSQPLHTHYAATSRTGAGAAAGGAAAPRGFAEYTGAGTGNIHNLKVVVDYASDIPRVYLTLTHYQYWALVAPPGGGADQFIPGGSQDIGAAQGTIAADPRVIAAGGVYQLMNPWIEILVP